MALMEKNKYVFSVFWAALLLSQMLCVSNICADIYGTRYISYASDISGNFNIYLMDTTSGNRHLLTNHPAHDREPTWSPDGRFLAFASNRDGASKIYVMDVKAAEPHRLTQRHEEEWAPAWSPDGKWIAFVSGDHGDIAAILKGEQDIRKITSNIYKADIDGGNLVQLTDRGKNLKPAWSPDSQRIAFVSYHRGNERKGIYVMDADGKRLRRLDDKAVQALDGIFQSVCAWSPDGKQLAFSILVPRTQQMHLCTIDVDGNNFRQLTLGDPVVKREHAKAFPIPGIRQPAWSPNGKWIAYVYPETGGVADIYVTDTAGNGRGIPLVKYTGRDNSPAWVPETFFSVSPSPEKQTTLWGRLKQKAD